MTRLDGIDFKINVLNSIDWCSIEDNTFSLGDINYCIVHNQK